MDNEPITVSSLVRPYHIDGHNFARAYKNHLSGFSEWDEAVHAEQWLLRSENIGTRLCIDESALSQGELYTFLTNPDGKARKGTLVAMVKGTKAEVVQQILKKIPFCERLKVKEVTMDLSDTMSAIVSECFPCAKQTIDRFHAQRLALDAMQEVRMQAKREAAKEQSQARKDFYKQQEINKKKRKDKGPKDPRGRKPDRANKAFKPFRYPNGDTKVELLTRVRYLLMVSPEKWTSSQHERWRLLKEHYPQVVEAYNLAHSLRVCYNMDSSDMGKVMDAMYNWYDKAIVSSIEGFKAVAETIDEHMWEILYYFQSRSTNAFAESFNAVIKRFRSELRGVADLPFFVFRLSKIFG